MSRRAKYVTTGLLAIAPELWGVELELGPEPSAFRTVGNAAIVDVGVGGALTHHPSFCFDSYDAIKARVGEALKSPATAVILNINSPGGDASGCFELSKRLRQMAKTAGKALIAYVDARALSSGYAIACAADRIVVGETGFVGSVGCCAQLLDVTGADKQAGLNIVTLASGRRKLDGNPHVAISDDMITAQQAQIDSMAGLFFELVAGVRNMTPEQVKGLEAATFHGSKAVAAGLADEVLMFEELLEEVSSGAGATGGVEVSAMDYKELVAALRATAKGDNDEEAKKAKAALAAMGEDDEDKDKKDKDAGEKTDDAKAEGDDDEKPEPDDKDKDKKAIAAKAATDNPVLALAAEVQSLSAWKASREEAEKREGLLASRPDFTAATIKALKSEPLATLEWAVKNLPKGATNPVRGALAAIGVQGTTGDLQGNDRSPRLSKEERADLDERMGVRAVTSEVRWNRGARVFPTIARQQSAPVRTDGGKVGA